MIKLLSTDFDGTLVDHEAAPAVSPDLFAALGAVQDCGGCWAINTGRELSHIVEGLQEFGFPVEPDFVLTSEREVFHRAPGGGWQDYGDWNRRCAHAHEQLFAAAGEFLAEIEDYLSTHPGAQPIFDGGKMIGLITANDSQMDRVCAFLEVERGKIPGFQYMRNTIYLRFCHEDYSKGAALGELARLLGLTREEIFAAGDHFNDLPMLDGRYAKWVCCPGNAIAPVQEAVRRAGGFVATGRGSDGVVEGLRHFKVHGVVSKEHSGGVREVRRG